MKGDPKKLFFSVTLLGMFLLNACAPNHEVVSASPYALDTPATYTLTIPPSLAPPPTRTFAPTRILADQTETPTPDYFLDDFPSETPLPSSTSPNGAFCDNSAFITDVTYPDGSVVAPSQDFKKTWELQNIGTCAWTASYTLNFVYGKRMNGVSTPIGSYVLPGQQIDVSVRLTAPNCQGNKHISYWQLANDSGKGFGARVYVSINVRLTATLMPGEVCTPMPTLTPYTPEP